MSVLHDLLITIRSTEDGYYRWSLRDGPQGTLSFAGTAPLLERCFEDILRSRRALAIDLTTHPHPEAGLLPHPSPHPEAPAQVHTPSGNTLAAQQDIPARGHPAESSTSIYPLPSKLG